VSALLARVRALGGRLGLLGWLVVVWVALWGDLSVANVLGGLVLAVLLVVLLPLTDVHETGLVKPLGVARFAVFFAADLVRASLQVVRLALVPRPLRPAVVRVPVRGASDGLLTLLANAISLTPGTLTLEVDRPNATLYVHVIDTGDGPGAVERVRHEILRVEHLAVMAVGSPEGRRAIREAMDETTEVPQ
jgi:multicomponent Na+:H+ antiporter subunit E